MRLFTVIASICVTLAAHAQLSSSELRRTPAPEGASATVGDIIGALRGRLKASVISVDWSTDSFVVPVAGNAAGSGGTYFRSDFTFNNDRLTDQLIAVGWMAQGANNCTAPLTYFTLTANSVTFADDFIGRQLNRTGLGAVLVVAVDATGNLDDEGEIDGVSRIWTPQPNSNGTVSQNFAAISVTDSLGSVTATLMGLKQSTQFRSNVGIVNFDDVPHLWTFQSIPTGTITKVSVQPCSMTQTGLAAGSASSTGNVALSVKSDGFGFWWSGYGSSTDNVTGDGWVTRAIQ